MTDEPQALPARQVLEAPPRWKPLTDEQVDDMVEAFNELQVTGHFAAIIGQSGNIAVELREQVIDPDTLAFVLDVADRHSLRPYIFRTVNEGQAPIVLQPLREQIEPADNAQPGDVHELHPDEPETGYRLIDLQNTIMLTLPVPDMIEDDWPTAQFPFDTAAERELAREVAEQAGQLAVARLAAGATPEQAVAEAADVGNRAFDKAKATLAGADPEPKEDLDAPA